MTKKDMTLLLSPTMLFAVLAVAAYFTSLQVQNYSKDDGHQQKFETFVTNVKSGKWDLTTDRWLEGMRREKGRGDAYREAYSDTAGMFQILLWTSLAGIVFQAVAVFTVVMRMRETMPNSAPEPEL
jgi:hypothetical protein